MKASEYIKRHPKSILAARLKKSVPPGKTIHVGHGIVKGLSPQSNAGKMLKSTKSRHVTIGGRAGKNRNDGHWFAVHK